MTNTYSLAEVENHKSKGDLWLVIRGKVYDVSKFVEDHPGGENAIYEEAGKDATAVFEDIGHSEYASDKLEELYIGDLEGYEAVEVVEEKVELEPETPPVEKKTGGSVLRVIVPTIIITGILLYRFVLAPKKN